MRIPYVIDNEERRLAEVPNQVLAEHAGRSLDVASAYFAVGGYAPLRKPGSVEAILFPEKENPES